MVNYKNAILLFIALGGISVHANVARSAQNMASKIGWLGTIVFIGGMIWLFRGGGLKSIVSWLEGGGTNNSVPNNSGTANTSSSQRNTISTTSAPLDEASLWYYADGEQEVGPVKLAELRQRINEQLVAKHTRVWREGMSDWSAAGGTELNSLFVAKPPPLTPKGPPPLKPKGPPPLS